MSSRIDFQLSNNRDSKNRFSEMEFINWPVKIDFWKSFKNSIKNRVPKIDF